MTKKFIHVPYGKTVHGEEEIAAVVSVLRRSTQMGEAVREMEKKYQNYLAKNLVLCLIQVLQQIIWL